MLVPVMMTFGMFAGGVTPPVDPPSAVVPAGRKRRYLVEVDGNTLEVRSPQEAYELLRKATALVEERITPKAIRIRRGKPVPPRPPVIKTREPELYEYVAKVNEDIRRVYANAMRDAEVAYLMRLKERADEEEFLISLL